MGPGERMNGSGKEGLEAIFRAAVAAVEPGRLVRESMRAGSGGLSLSGGPSAETVPWDGIRSIFLVGGGKAGRRMGEAAVSILGERVTAGVLAVPSGQGGSAGPVRFLDDTQTRHRRRSVAGDRLDPVADDSGTLLCRKTRNTTQLEQCMAVDEYWRHVCVFGVRLRHHFL